MVQYLNVDQLIERNRLFRLLRKKVLECPSFDSHLYDLITAYTDRYLSSLESTYSPTDIYTHFITDYSRDMKRYLDTGLYPLFSDNPCSELSRIDYDVVLLFSCLLSPHRYQIMRLIDAHSPICKSGLIIGCGPGLEIEIVRSRIQQLIAYDVKVNALLQRIHPEVIFREQLFIGGVCREKYQVVYLIEILEHLTDPFALIRDCVDAMSDDGRIILTTATNIPQFDHLFNFERSHALFLEQIHTMGLRVSFEEDLPHEYLTIDIGAANRFFVLAKK